MQKIGSDYKMKTAFLILAHKNPWQLELLVEYLAKNDCAVFVHVDKKQKDLFTGFYKTFEHNKNVFIYSKFRVYWGGFNQIRATFFLLEQSLKHSDFDFVSLISGQDAPIKPVHAFKDYLSSRRDLSFVSWHQMPAIGTWVDNGGMDRINYYWLTAFPKSLGFFFNRVMVVVHAMQKRLKIFKQIDLPLYGGANWFTLNREMADYVIEYIHKNKSFFKKFRNTRCADEIILQTILLNSPFKSQIVNDALRFIDWSSGPEYPRTFRTDDIERLLQNKDFFARKFDQDVDKNVLEHIYRRL